jgi:hypothetical protein
VFEWPISRLNVRSDMFQNGDISMILSARKAKGLAPILDLEIYMIEPTCAEIRVLATAQQRPFDTLRIACTYDAPEITDFLPHFDWNALRGVRHLAMRVTPRDKHLRLFWDDESEGDPDITDAQQGHAIQRRERPYYPYALGDPMRGPSAPPLTDLLWETPTQALSLTPPQIDHVNLASFDLTIDAPKGDIARLPSISQLAETLLAIGGPTCAYKVDLHSQSYAGPRGLAASRLKLLETESDLFNRLVNREIDMLLAKESGVKGWRKST